MTVDMDRILSSVISVFLQDVMEKRASAAVEERDAPIERSLGLPRTVTFISNMLDSPDERVGSKRHVSIPPRASIQRQATVLGLSSTSSTSQQALQQNRAKYSSVNLWKNEVDRDRSVTMDTSVKSKSSESCTPTSQKNNDVTLGVLDVQIQKSQTNIANKDISMNDDNNDDEDDYKNMTFASMSSLSSVSDIAGGSCLQDESHIA